MPNHWTDELVRSKNTVASGTRVPPAAFCSSSCFDSTTDTESSSTFENPSIQTYSSSSAATFTHSFNSGFSPGTRLRASSDKEAWRTPTHRSALNSNSPTPFRSRSG
jgi:hypothetical protein